MGTPRRRWMVCRTIPQPLYMCAIFFPRTSSMRDVDMVTFIPVVDHFPQVITEDLLKQAALDIRYIYSNPLSTTTVDLEAGDNTKKAILKIAQALQRVEKITELSKNSSNVKDKITAQLPRVVNEPLPSVRHHIVCCYWCW